MAGVVAGAGIAGSMMRGGANIVSRHATTGRWTGGGTMIGGTVATGAVAKAGCADGRLGEESDLFALFLEVFVSRLFDFIVKSAYFLVHD
jgi:hypothetical protein